MDKLNNVEKKQEVLKENNITKIKQLQCLNGQTESVKNMTKVMKCIIPKTLTNYVNQVFSVILQEYPPMIDHIKSKTPYKSLYGSDAQRMLDESVSLKMF